jgi:glycosyltransferase involved in cell wall biosynthesis
MKAATLNPPASGNAVAAECAPAERIRLLTMVTNFKIGGTERQVANIALRIDSTRFDLHLACMQNFGELSSELEHLKVPRPQFNIGPLYALRTGWQAIRMARYVRKNGVQIVHSYGFYPNVFAVAATRLAGRPIVIASIRDMGDDLTPLQKNLQRAVCRWADCILVNAEAIRQRLISQGYRPDNIVVIRNGIMLSRFDEARAAAGSARVREELNLPPACPIIVVFCRLNQMKGVDYFLDAAAVVARRFPDVRFLIAGDGAHKGELEQQADRMGLRDRTVFTGFRCDVPALLAEASLSVLPSLSEGLSNSLLESMAAGVPAIAARVGGNPEVIADEETGILVPPRDSAALAGAMTRLLENPELARRFGEAGRRRVEEHFSVERSVRETESLYRELVAAGGRI